MKRDFSISRLFAFTVSPNRTANAKAAPVGGQCEINEGLRQLIADSIARADFDMGPEVLFQFEPGNERKCAMRSSILQCAFAPVMPANQGAMAIATRLANAMDERSDACLLILCVEKNNAARRVTLWVYPRDTAFQFSMDGTQSHIDILKEVFSQSSTLRKAARFQGKDNDNGFIDGRIVDRQLGYRNTRLAGFWVDRFLQCALSFTSALGTTELSRALRTTMETAATPESRAEVAQTIAAVRQSKRTRWSVQALADEYFSGETKDRFLRAMGDEQARSAVFELDRPLFDKSTNFQIFELETGVFVSSPFKEIDRSVIVTRPKDKTKPARLKLEGDVKAEMVRTRHA